MTAPLPVREYASVAELRARYAALHRATFAPRHAEPKAPAFVFREPPPAPLEPIPPPDIEATRAAYAAVRQEYLTKRRAVGAVEKPMADCLRIVWAVTGVSVVEIKGRNLLPDLVKARQIAMFLMVNVCRRSRSETGIFLGGRDHTTVLWGCRRAELAVREHNITDFSDPVAVAHRLWDVSWPKFSRARSKASS